MSFELQKVQRDGRKTSWIHTLTRGRWKSHIGATSSQENRDLYKVSHFHPLNFEWKQLRIAGVKIVPGAVVLPQEREYTREYVIKKVIQHRTRWCHFRHKQETPVKKSALSLSWICGQLTFRLDLVFQCCQKDNKHWLDMHFMSSVTNWINCLRVRFVR